MDGSSVNDVESGIQALLWACCPIYRHAGLTVESARDGLYRCRLPLDAGNGNHLATMHAALQWALAEVLGGLVVLTAFGAGDFSALYAAVKSAQIDFLRPARTALTAEAQFATGRLGEIRALVEDGKEACFPLAVVVRAADGEVVARFSADYVVRPRRDRRR